MLEGSSWEWPERFPNLWSARLPAIRPLPSGPYPGTDDAIELGIGVARPAPPADGRYVTNAKPRDSVTAAPRSPLDAYLGEPFLLLAQVFPTGNPPTSPTPLLHLDAPIVLLSGDRMPRVQPEASLVLDERVAGMSVLFQGVVLSPATANGWVALTHGHEVRVQ